MSISVLFRPRTSVLEEAIASWMKVNETSTAEMRRSIADSDARIADSDARIATALAKSAEAEAGLRAVSERLEYWVGRYGDKIGALIERILIPGIKPVMNKYGHNFTTISPNREYYRSKGKRLTEIDLLLENGGEAMAVEVKTRMCEDNVTKHLKRLKLLREYEEVLGLTGKTLYGAMAGLVIDEAARKLALDSGLYIVEMVEDSKHVNVVEPPAGVQGW